MSRFDVTFGKALMTSLHAALRAQARDVQVGLQDTSVKVVVTAIILWMMYARDVALPQRERH